MNFVLSQEVSRDTILYHLKCIIHHLRWKLSIMHTHINKNHSRGHGYNKFPKLLQNKSLC